MNDKTERDAFEAWFAPYWSGPQSDLAAWSGWQARAAIAQSGAPAGWLALSGKYGDVLTPFVALMEAELHANSQKGDRPGWLTMSPETGLLEIYWHTSKLSAAVKNNDGPAIIEHSADVANMAMMLLDVCGGLAVAASPQPQPQPVQTQTQTSDVQWQKRHPNRDAGEWVNTNEHDAKWWKANGNAGWEIRVLYAKPVEHEGMTIAGNGAEELGALMREQWSSPNRGGIYPDGNPNAANRQGADQ